MLMNNDIIKQLQEIVNIENVLFDEKSRIEFSTDALDCMEEINLPDVIVFVETIEQIQKIVKLAKEYKIPIVCRGAGTNTVGACIAEKGGIVLNFSKMNKILEINQNNMTVRVQPGVIVGDLQKKVEDIGLFYPPDPSSLNVSTIGGSIAQNSAGARTFKYGSTKDYVINLLVVNSDGEIFQTGSNTIKNSTGFNLNSLFVGSEGTLGVIVEATLKLIVKPQTSKVLMAYFDSISDATNAVQLIIQKQITPATIDFMDKNVLKTVEDDAHIGLLTNKEACLIIELDGTKSLIDEQEKIILEVLQQKYSCKIEVSNTKEEADRIWYARRSSFNICKKIKPNVITDDVIVPRENLPQLVEGINSICKKYNLIVCMVGHVGDGSVHPQIPLDLSNQEEYNNYKLAQKEIYNLTSRLGGIISGEHGIGREKREFISKFVDNISIEYMRKIKQIFDSENIFNPDKIF